MPDIALIYRDGLIDLDFGDGGTAIDESLRTAVIISLFTDGRAAADDLLPDGGTDRRGWWGDIYPQVAADRIGSRLWLLSREKQLPAVLQRAQAYALEALQWLRDDGLVTDLAVTALFVRAGMIGLIVRLRPVGQTSPVIYRAVVGAATGAGVAILDESGNAILDESGQEIWEE